MMKLEREDALYCANAFHEYFNGITDIESYMREEKLKHVENIPNNPLFPLDQLMDNTDLPFQLPPDVLQENRRVMIGRSFP